MNFTTKIQLSLITTLFVLVFTRWTNAQNTCQMDIVKMHAFHACDYFSDQLHEDHYRMTTRQSRLRRHASTLEEKTTNLPTTETVHKHDFKTRYSRPTHLSIRNLSDAFLVMDYPYAKILRKHSSHRYKMMGTHFHFYNGTMEKDHHEEPAATTDEPQSQTQHTSHQHNHQHHQHHRHHHRSHHLAQLQAEADAPHHHPSDPITHEDSSNQLDNTIHTRRTRDIHVAVSACCRDIEKCIHAMCPM